MDKKSIFKKILSIVLVYHLLGTILLANPESYFSKGLSPLYQKLYSFLGLSLTWSYFAPNPTRSMNILEYETFSESGEVLESKSFPDMGYRPFFANQQNRKMNVVNYFFLGDYDTTSIMGDYFCRLNPNAKRAELRKTRVLVPTLKEIKEKEISKFSDYEKESEWVGVKTCVH